MGRDLLPNESRTGLSLFFRSLLVLGQVLILSFAYATVYFLGKKYVLVSISLVILGIVIIWHIERSLRVDEKIRKGESIQQLSMWTFVRLVILGAGVLVIIKALGQLFSLLP